MASKANVLSLAELGRPLILNPVLPLPEGNPNKNVFTWFGGQTAGMRMLLREQSGPLNERTTSVLALDAAAMGIDVRLSEVSWGYRLMATRPALEHKNVRSMAFGIRDEQAGRNQVLAFLRRLPEPDTFEILSFSNWILYRVALHQALLEVWTHSLRKRRLRQLTPVQQAIREVLTENGEEWDNEKISRTLGSRLGLKVHRSTVMRERRSVAEEQGERFSANMMLQAMGLDSSKDSERLASLLWSSVEDFDDP